MGVDEDSRLVKSTAVTGAILILASTALILIGNRWAGYIITPIPGLYLADALLVVGSLFACVRFRSLMNAPRWIWIVFGLVWIYVGGVLLTEFVFASDLNRSMALRDAAPFLYLSLVPFMALALTTIGTKALIAVVRWSIVALALLSLATWVGLLTPFPSPLLGTNFAEVFGSRTDLTGAAFGAGIVAWGRWTQVPVRAVPLLQFGLVVVAFLTVGSRSGLMALLVCMLIAVWRSPSRPGRLAVALGAVAAFLVGISLQGFGQPAVSEPAVSEPAVSEPAVSEPAVSEPAVSEPAVSEPSVWSNVAQWFELQVFERSGTVGARISTYSDIGTGMTEDQTWLLGGSAGSDYLYELCTGLTEAPTANNLGQPKCAVDSGGPQPPTRDPHNWVLNIVLYHGLVGLGVFVTAFAVPMWRCRRSNSAALPVSLIVAYLVSGFTMLISAGYALIPMTFALAWLVRNAYLAPGVPGNSIVTTEPQSDYTVP
jgi:hypothetical protein